MSRRLSTKSVQNHINSLPMPDIYEILDNYSVANHVNSNILKRYISEKDIQTHLIESNINTECPCCNSTNIVKNGKRNGIMRFKCKKCGKQFTLFSGTILEKTKFSWDVWVAIVHMVLNKYPVRKMQKNLIETYNLKGLDYKTVFLCKHKIIHAMAAMPMPKLSGIIQVDETFFRESQKGSRHLVSTIGETRKARKGHRPSKYGVMGNEFANVVCLLDSNGNIVSKVIGLGKLTVETFTSEFWKYIDKPMFMCSDGNHVYKQYCSLEDIPLFVLPSNRYHVLQKNDYYSKNYKERNILINKLYRDKEIEYIYTREYLDYDNMLDLVYKYNLNLAYVNEFHGELKNNCNAIYKGVSTKYLPDYIGAYTYIKNWENKNKTEATTYNDAETILIELITRKIKYTGKDMKNTPMYTTKCTNKYMQLLKEKTKKIQLNKDYKFFRFSEEDNVLSFDKRKFLYDLPKNRLQELRRKYKYPAKWVTYSIINHLLKEPTIEDDIFELIKTYGHYEDDFEVDDYNSYLHYMRKRINII